MSSLRGRPEVLTALILTVLSLVLLIAGAAMSALVADGEGVAIGAGLAWMTAIGTTASAIIAWAVALIAARRR